MLRKIGHKAEIMTGDIVLMYVARIHGDELFDTKRHNKRYIIRSAQRFMRRKPTVISRGVQQLYVSCQSVNYAAQRQQRGNEEFCHTNDNRRSFTD